MTAAAANWEAAHISVDAVTEAGTVVRVHGVHAERNRKTGKIRISPEEILRAQFRDIVTEAGLQEARDLATLSILGAPAGNLPVPFVQYKYALNKMLFYQQKILENQGLGDAFPHDNFVAERKGPVPEHIDEDLKRLEDAGLITIDKPTGKEHKPWVIKLTPRGKSAAETILGKTDVWFRTVAHKVKSDLFTLNPQTLKERVHTEFPEYRRKYVEIDAS